MSLILNIHKLVTIMKTVSPFGKQAIFVTTGVKDTEEYVSVIHPGQILAKVIQPQKIEVVSFTEFALFPFSVPVA